MAIFLLKIFKTSVQKLPVWKSKTIKPTSSKDYVFKTQFILFLRPFIEFGKDLANKLVRVINYAVKDELIKILSK